MAGHLRLVKPVGPKAPKKPRRAAPVFSPEEQARLRAALKNARPLLGSWPCLADAMRVPKERIQRAAAGRHPVTADVAVRLSRAIGVPLEALLRGLTSVPPTCPTCGRGGAT